MIPIDPCGAVCDIGRRPYRTKARFFRDSDVETDIVWYEALPGAPVLPVPSFVAGLDWWVQERSLGVYQDGPIGEVADRPRPYSSFKAPRRAKGLHRCGTDDEWENGAEYDPERINPRASDGLPLCCPGIPADVAVGGRALRHWSGRGVLVGGRANPGYPPAMFGNVVVGGHAREFPPCVVDVQNYCAGYPYFDSGFATTGIFAGGTFPTCFRWGDGAADLFAPEATDSPNPGVWQVTYLGSRWEAPAYWEGFGEQTFTRVVGTDGNASFTVGPGFGCPPED